MTPPYEWVYSKTKFTIFDKLKHPPSDRGRMFGR